MKQTNAMELQKLVDAVEDAAERNRRYGVPNTRLVRAAAMLRALTGLVDRREIVVEMPTVEEVSDAND